MKTKHLGCDVKLTLRPEDFQRPPAYHIDMWEDLLYQLDLPAETPEVAIWISTVDYWPLEDEG